MVYSQTKHLNFQDEEDDDDYVEGEEEEDEGELWYIRLRQFLKLLISHLFFSQSSEIIV